MRRREPHYQYLPTEGFLSCELFFCYFLIKFVLVRSYFVCVLCSSLTSLLWDVLSGDSRAWSVFHEGLFNALCLINGDGVPPLTEVVLQAHDLPLVCGYGPAGGRGCSLGDEDDDGALTLNLFPSTNAYPVKTARNRLISILRTSRFLSRFLFGCSSNARHRVPLI